MRNGGNIMFVNISYFYTLFFNYEKMDLLNRPCYSMY